MFRTSKTCLALLMLAVVACVLVAGLRAAEASLDAIPHAAQPTGGKPVAGLLIPAKARLIIGYSRVALA